MRNFLLLVLVYIVNNCTTMVMTDTFLSYILMLFRNAAAGGGGGLSAEVDALLAPLLRERGAAAAAKAEAEAAAVAPPFTREPEHSEPSLAITSLLNMGFERAVAEEALLRYDGSAPRAIEWLLSNS